MFSVESLGISCDRFLVLEHVSGGELFDYLVKKGKLPLGEVNIIRVLMVQLKMIRSRESYYTMNMYVVIQASYSHLLSPCRQGGILLR